MFSRVVFKLMLGGVVCFTSLCAIAAKTERDDELVKQAENKTKQAEGQQLQQAANKASEKAKETFKDGLKEEGDKAIDRLLPGGDNRVAHDIWHDVVDRKPFRAVTRALFEPSEISPLQGKPGTPMTIVKSGPEVVPANPSNDQAISREHVTDNPVVPAAPSNQKGAAPRNTPVVVPEDSRVFGDAPLSFAPLKQNVSERPVVPASPSNQNAAPAHADGHFNFGDIFKGSAIGSMPRDVGVTVVNPGNRSSDRPGPSEHEGHADHYTGPDHFEHTSHIA